jgi:hypothetical protein
MILTIETAAKFKIKLFGEEIKGITAREKYLFQYATKSNLLRHWTQKYWVRNRRFEYALTPRKGKKRVGKALKIRIPEC